MVDNIIETPLGQTFGNYRTIALGVKFNIKGILLIYLDPHLTPSLPSDRLFGHNVGVEIVVLKDFFLRGGHYRNSNIPYLGVMGYGYGLGGGWLGPRLSLDYGFTHSSGPISTDAHSFGVSLFF